MQLSRSLFVVVASLLSWMSLAAAQAPSPPEEINAAALTAGARLHYPSDDYGVDGSTELVDGRVGTANDNQGEAVFPIEEKLPVVRRIELAEPFELSRVEVVGSWEGACCAGAHPGSSVKKLKLEVGAGLNGPWKPLADVTLKKGRAPQSFPIKASKARYVRVSLLENFGNKEYISVGDLRLFGKRSAPRAKVDFTGAFSNGMLLAQKGLRVTGCVGGAETLFEGTVDGVVLAGRKWTKGSDDPATELVLVLNAEGELRGIETPGGTRFDGDRVKASEYAMSCEKPEQQLAADLKKNGRVALRGILFDTGKDVIRPESVPVLEALAAAMKADPKKRYLVEGHTDDRGGAAQNLTLSDKRAAAVKKWLVDHGIAKERLETKGFGQTKPTQPNDSEAGRAANRRVEVAAI